MEEKMPYDPREPGRPMAMNEASSRPRRNPERTKELLMLAENIALMIGDRVQGGDLCRLRQMVEMFLER